MSEPAHSPISSVRYTSAAFATLEWERMWTKVWLLGCREADLPLSGSFVTLELGHESILFVRGGDQRIRGFFNVCQHRGNRLKHKEMGCEPSLRCGYHRWEYALDGALCTVPDADTFPQGIPCDRLRLPAIRTSSWAGFVWFDLGGAAGALSDYLGEIAAELEPHDLGSQQLVSDRTVELDCNWKVCVDGFNETYHVHGTHPQILGYMDELNAPAELFTRHSRAIVPMACPSPHLVDRAALNDDLRNLLRRWGLDPASFEGRAGDVRAALQRAKGARASAAGLDVSRLSDAQLTDDYQYTIFPNTTLNVHLEGVTLFRHRPHATDPGRMLLDVQHYQRAAPGAGSALRVPHLRERHGESSLGWVLDQDLYTLPFIQRGMRSAGFAGPWLSEQEKRIQHFHGVLDRYLAG